MSDQNLPSWAARLRAEREIRGWSRAEMGRRLLRAAGFQIGSVSNMTRMIYRWERGQNFPRDWAATYATAFDMPETDLFPPVYKPPTFGEKLRTLLADRGLSLTELAWIVGEDAGHLSKIACDDVIPSEQQAAALLDAAEHGSLTTERATAGTAPAANVDEADIVDDWREMERRLLLQLAALGLGGGALGPSRHLLDLALTAEPRTVEDWQLACGDHLHAIRTRPPALVRDDLGIDLLAIHRQLRAASTEDIPELHRVRAALSTLYANVLTRLGDHGSALRWWRTAREAADTSGDLDLRLLVRGQEAGFGLYGQRHPEAILSMTQRARRIAASGPSLGLVQIQITITEAKALSLLGRHDAAKQAMNAVIHTAPEDPPPNLIPAYWTSDQVHFAQSWVHAYAGEEAAADEARDRVLAHEFLDYQYAANVRLHGAICTVMNGGIDEGVRQAATVLDTLARAHRSHMITETGNTLLRLVPIDQRERPAVREFRGVLAGTAPA